MTLSDAPAGIPLHERYLFLAHQEHEAGRLEAAIDWYRRALNVRSDFPEARNNFGIALRELGRFEEAVAQYRAALAQRPQSAEIWNNLGDAVHALGDPQGAVEHYRHALSLEPAYGTAWRNLGDALAELGAHGEAAECHEKAVALEPLLDARLSPADLIVRDVQLKFAMALQRIDDASQRDPLFAAAYHAAEAGQLAPAAGDEATARRHRLAARLHTHYAEELSRALMTILYSSAVTPEGMQQAQNEVARFYGGLPRYSDFPNAPDPERPLRIGCVSADLRTHSVAYFLAPVFDESGPSANRIYCYYGGRDEDQYTAFFRARAAGWRNTIAMSGGALAEAVRADGIDILLDLSGHTTGNRLDLFARRPAPIQVSWLGFPDSTGLKTIDYRLTDAIADPPGAAGHLADERLVRLPDGFHCYAPPAAAPEVAALPAASNGYVTFGSFNNLYKVTQGVLDLWASILQRLPQSRLLLKGRGVEVPTMAERLIGLFERRGVARERVTLMARPQTNADHLALYGKMDIALDTFPYNGTTTTCEAMWMGVPVVSLKGDRHAARVGASLLTRVGLAELVAATPDAYVETAVRLASDTGALATLRRQLRPRIAASPLCDAPAFARALDAAFRALWRDWCARSLGSTG